MKRHLLSSLVVLCSAVQFQGSAQDHNEAIATHIGRGVRVNNAERLTSTTTISERRRLEDNNNADENNEANDDAAAENYDDDGAVTDDDIYDANQTTTTMENIKSKIQTYESKAESTAWEMYQSQPSEWSTAQWDVVLAVLAIFFMTCCFLSTCCAYHCLRADEEKFPLSSKDNKRTTARSRHRGNSKRGSGRSSRNRHNDSDDEDSYYNMDEYGRRKPKKGCNMGCLV